ncbi:MAG: hypothetical protein QOI03_672, partial [Solirubrobacteraceae bacterium]|nr:hypothetical protein [Solirubrobacteraceae bacterium]
MTCRSAYLFAYPLRRVLLRFGDELRADVLLLRLVLAAVVLGLALVLFAVPRPEADLAPADLAAVTFAPAAFAPALLAALLVVLRAVRDADAGLPAAPDLV